MSFRTLIKQLILSEIKQRSPHFRWKFDPEAFAAQDWDRVWSGIEEFGGHFFQIRIVSHQPSGKKKIDLRIGAAPTLGRLQKFEIAQAPLFSVMIARTIDPDKITRAEAESWADELRKQLEYRASDPGDALFSQLSHRAAKLEAMPPWHYGRWKLPTQDPNKNGVVIGDRLDLGFFQVIVVKRPGRHWYDCLVVARTNFDPGQPRQTWQTDSRWSFDDKDLVKNKVEDYLYRNFNFDNHDPDYLETQFKALMIDASLKEW